MQFLIFYQVDQPQIITTVAFIYHTENNFVDPYCSIFKPTTPASTDNNDAMVNNNGSACIILTIGTWRIIKYENDSENVQFKPICI